MSQLYARLRSSLLMPVECSPRQPEKLVDRAIHRASRRPGSRSPSSRERPRRIACHAIAGTAASVFPSPSASRRFFHRPAQASPELHVNISSSSNRSAATAQRQPSRQGCSTLRSDFNSPSIETELRLRSLIAVITLLRCVGEPGRTSKFRKSRAQALSYPACDSPAITSAGEIE